MINKSKTDVAKVIIIQRIFSEYRKSVLNKLNSHIDFILLHSENKSGINQASAPYSKKIWNFQYSRNKTNLFLNVFPYILKNRPKIIIHEFSIGILTLIPTYFLSRLLKLKFILWGHGYDRSKGFYPEKSFNDKLRLFLLKKADAVIFYGQEAKLLFSEYMKCDKLFIAYNCLNTNGLTAIRDKLEKEGRENIKKRIGFTDKYNLIFIARLLKIKQPQILIDIYEYLINIYGNIICVHFVGDGDYLNQLKEIVRYKGLENNIKFYGAIHDDIKNSELLYCSDLMVMPGPVGLSVNHAFNFDCPVVTYQQKGHGPEIEYLINEKTGFIVEKHSAEAMSIIISKYLDSKDIQSQMKLNIRYMIETTCSINNFLKGFDDAIKFVLREN
jgi:glycosyltransferase involved in cell wall biosynthesis